MRIIAGEKRGHGLVAPKGDRTRPTLGRVRESVFSILGSDILNAHVVDLFAGAGTLGLEALSRGAAHCTFVESDASALKALRANLDKLAYGAQARVVSLNVFTAIPSVDLTAHPQIIFADPPYHQELGQKTLEALETAQIFSGSVLILQYGKRDKICHNPNRWSSLRVERYGETTVQFFASIPQSEPR